MLGMAAGGNQHKAGLWHAAEYLGMAGQREARLEQRDSCRGLEQLAHVGGVGAGGGLNCSFLHAVIFFLKGKNGAEKTLQR